MESKEELKVFISHRDSVCGECKESLGSSAWIVLDQAKGALCLTCADMDHLEFLQPGDRALTLRAKKYSSLYAVVLRWSRNRKRYERQGLLVEEEAIQKAEAECLKDADARERRRIREAEKRTYADKEYIDRFAKRVRDQYPNIPKGVEDRIARHACKKYSGRVGRSSAAKSFSEQAVLLAVRAHIRHAMTNYDELLSKGWDRSDARSSVDDKVFEILDKWQGLERL